MVFGGGGGGGGGEGEAGVAESGNGDESASWGKPFAGLEEDVGPIDGLEREG